ncbi:DUF3618 domain-containing protein [Pseudomonas coleopterorum]|uniref:DUF3618 domain-containing protein n=1 Tax=Pseudomonas coleopterorum TaxID=1605838 RepID=UPI000F06000F|nr:DUF3618 domain-containing protein [Pseudomonas coleopterorum]MBD8483883.1 DUF3618 domain-containing protein [Pseudomonas coleopterorum]
MSSSLNSDLDKSPEDLEREIDAKRASISNLVDSLESRFTPGQLFDQALSYTKGNGGEFFQNLGTTLKNNPVPTVLTGVGLAWLAMNQNKPFQPGSTSSGSGLGGKVSQVVDQVSQAFSGAGDRLHGAADTARDHGQSLRSKAGDLSERATDSLDATASQLTDKAHDVGQRVQEQASEVKGQFEQLLKEQPLVLAAIGIALGAALGAALPSTRKEDEWMGQTRDDLADTLKSKGQEAYAVAKDTVKQATDKAPEPSAAPSPVTPASASEGTDLSSGLGMKP